MSRISKKTTEFTSKENDANEVKFWEEQLRSLQLRVDWAKEDYAKKWGGEELEAS